ncbi:MAG TPA: HAMP domain-containing sensor histidine kinase [Candidatus Limnocylindrales bacterium]|nr:HAMP domain-containing sensor histidine kinase [Candidatus Limnocylindrales bacterium]
MADGRQADVASGQRALDARRRNPVPQSFQTRLTFAFMAVVALTLTLVSPVIVVRLDDFFRNQEEARLQERADATAGILVRAIGDTVGDQRAVIWVDPATGSATLAPDAEALLLDAGWLQLVTDQVAQATVKVQFGPATQETDGVIVTDPDAGLTFVTKMRAPPTSPQREDPAIAPALSSAGRANESGDWGVVVELSNPYTSRATTLAAITGLLLVMAGAALLVAVLVAAFLAHRFTVPITRLTDASRRLAEGDLASRVATDELSSGTLELRALSTQFNQMADRLEESVDIIRRDRDRSRDFLADVSHELRTPIAAMRTFVELLQGPAGLDPAARTEFLDSSAVQLDRLDWLAQNLLELSKLDSGLVLLDLRPDDVRATIESAVEQQLASAERKGIGLTVALPDRPLRIRHDPPRIGQVVTNLVGNALKFTARGGSVRVTARPEADGGARIEVIDTGAGIPAAELPRIFDRFFRGTAMNEARSTGSGLGLSIVKSILDMHHGTIAVESRVGHGTRFVVTLPRDPREVDEVETPSPDPPGSGNEVPAAPARALSRPDDPKVDVSSPTGDPPVNLDRAPLSMVSGQAETTMTSVRERSSPTP